MKRTLLSLGSACAQLATLEFWMLSLKPFFLEHQPQAVEPFSYGPQLLTRPPPGGPRI